jgi:hypothetical protein
MRNNDKNGQANESRLYGNILGQRKNRCPTVAQNKNFSLIYRLSLIRSMILLKFTNYT